MLLAGDASGYVDALTGEGMRVGFAQARAAVAAVRAGNTEQYERAWRATTRDFRMLTSALVVAARSRFRSADRADRGPPAGAVRLDRRASLALISWALGMPALPGI